jgi:NAD(P)-dependent dehydrogenase (short-subunit alcohol dehydrogenase family)
VLLTGKVSLLTGAASGIGRATAIRAAREGSRVVITDVNEAGLEETRRVIESEGGEALARAADLASVAALRSVVDACDERFGELHIVMNIAGIHAGGPIDGYTEADWERVHAINSKAPYFLIQSALPLMRRTGPGAIVNVSSLSGVIGVEQQSLYCSSKGAVVAFTRGLALDLAKDDIRVNCVCPGATDTAQPATFLANFDEAEQERLKEGWFARQLQKRFASPDEIASTVVFLASDESAFTTGVVLNVDGGWTTW